MSHPRRFAVAAALAASRVIPRSVPVLGPLVRTGLMTLSASAALTYAFVNLARQGTNAGAGGSSGVNPGGASRTTGAVRPYEEWTRDELYHRAQELDIEGRSRLNKDELIAALRAHR